MINKIVAIQGNHPSKLNPNSDTSVFLANEIQNKNYKIFYYDPKDLSVINSKVIALGFFIKFNYLKNKFFKIVKKQKLDLTKCKFIDNGLSTNLIRIHWNMLKQLKKYKKLVLSTQVTHLCGFSKMLCH